MANRAHGAAFLNRILGHIPEADRAVIAEKLQGNTQLLDALAADAEAVAGVDDDRARLTDWYNRNKTALERAKPLLDAQAAGKLRLIDDEEDPDTDPLGLGGSRRTPASAGLDEKTVAGRITAAVDAARAEHAQQLAAVQEQGITIINKMTMIGLQHMKEFNEVLNTDELTAFAMKHNLRLDLAYEQFVKDRRDASLRTANEAALAAAREEGLQAGRMEALNRQIPIPAGSASGTLTGLGKTGADVIDASMPALVQELRQAELASSGRT